MSIYQPVYLGGLLLAVGICSLNAFAEPSDNEQTDLDVEYTVSPAEGLLAFETVYRVLQHPRCLNCHPSGDTPLQYDSSVPHAMNITRASVEAGLDCATCHQTQNSEAYGVAGGPPGAPNWHLPDKEMPLIFEGRSIAELCAQLLNPAENGQKTLEQLYAHVAHDPLVLWGWNPGGNRTLPPVDHATFTRSFRTWMDAGTPCAVEDSTSVESD